VTEGGLLADLEAGESWAGEGHMKTSKQRIILMTGCSLSLLAIATPAIAQEQGAGVQETQQHGGLSDIVVTARRVAEDIQTVPISIGALSAEDLEARQIDSLNELRGAVANVNITKTTVAGGNFMTIRGKTGIALPNVSIDSAVGFYVDGIYYGRPQSSGGEVADVERIEVLRGPQGTLFGRNSSAGAINFITRAPSGEFGVQGELGYGNFDRKKARISIDTPTFGGGFSARATFLHESYEGDVVNTKPGSVYDFAEPWPDTVTTSRFGGANTETIMAKLRYDDGGAFTMEYKYDWLHRVEVPIPMQALGFAPGISSWLATSPFSPFGGGGLGLYQMQRPGDVNISRTRLGATAMDSTAASDIKVHGHMLTLGLELNQNLALKSINSFRKLNTYAGNETDGGIWTLPLDATTRATVCLACAITITKQRQVSSELQLLGTYDRFSFILGGFYFRERAISDLPLMNFLPFFSSPFVVPTSGPTNAFAVGQRELVHNTSYAAYAHFDYKVTDALTLAAGARYSHDKRDYSDRRDPLPPGTPQFSKISFSKPTFDVSLSYVAAPDVNLYAKFATGYQSGGIVRGTPFRPEKSNSIEAGIKSEWFDRRVRLNAALFRTKFTSVQNSGFSPVLGLYAFNAGSTVTKGAEIELTAVPVDGLTLTANFGYGKAKNSQGLRMGAPKTNLAFSAQYDTPEFSNGSYVSFRIDGDYRDKYYSAGVLLAGGERASTDFPLPAYVWQGAGFGSEQAYFNAVFGAGRLGGYALVNARVSLVDLPISGAKVRTSAFVRNIFKEDKPYFGSQNGVFLMASFERPRTYGVDLSFEF